MRKENEKESNESEKVFALTIVLTNILLLTVAGGIFWLVQLIVSEQNRFDNLVRDFIVR